MTDKSNQEALHQHHHHHHSPNEAIHKHASGHGDHVAHQHNTWMPEDYEQKVKAMSYNGHKLVVEQFATFGIAKDSKILDLAAGTGLVGALLGENGYTNIDALDGSADMLVAANNCKCYQKIITHFIEKDIQFPIEDHTYDHIIMSGALCHIDYESLPQIIRTCKPGGIICWAIGQSEDLIHKGPQFMDGKFEKYIKSLVEENVWQYLPGFPKRVNNYAMERDGWVYAMKVL